MSKNTLTDDVRIKKKKKLWQTETVCVVNERTRSVSWNNSARAVGGRFGEGYGIWDLGGDNCAPLEMTYRGLLLSLINCWSSVVALVVLPQLCNLHILLWPIGVHLGGDECVPAVRFSGASLQGSSGEEQTVVIDAGTSD